MTVDQDGWVKAAELDDLWEGDIMPVTVVGEELILIHLPGGHVSAFLAACPHQGNSLAEGYLEGDKLVCPAHLWEFDARSGAGVNPDNCTLVTRTVRVDGDSVWVACPRAARAADSETDQEE